jgi:uncharacterized zinc-type alcohol dehydrogenase-like protein
MKNEVDENSKQTSRRAFIQQTTVAGARGINEAWDKVVNKEARYRYVIDASTI